MPRHDPAEGRPNYSSSSFQAAPDGYPHPPVESGIESYHIAPVSPQTPFVLPSAMAGTPDCGSLPGPCPATAFASEETASQPSSIASTQMSCAAFNIVPVPIERPSEKSELIIGELLEEVHKRQAKVASSLGKIVFDEACKGLSRVLHPADDTDIQLFGIQLRRSGYAACEQDYHRCGRDNIPIFAISYTHRNRSVGSYKFSDDSWDNFQVAMHILVNSNVQKVRVWLDQCLWLRDSNLGCWAHTGLIPYIKWPVFSLGVKAPERDRTFESFYRVWPYLEEIAGIWSMGVITTCELHQEDEQDCPSPVTHVRYNQRVCLEPQASLYLLFHAICDGKITDLDCACNDDVHELIDMAKFNMEHE
ncbi:hypothetical protein FGB62_75g017 [Gracilaria domingensis]|nr:hypothetical protein FGB62_75g017 [Gracilaria domingensis]